MLLRIVIADSSSTESNTQGSSNKKLKTFHACLSTASHHYDAKNYGTICQIGRKNSDVIFEGEKSVSRAHCAIRIVSIHAKTDVDGNLIVNEGNSQDDEEVGNVALPPASDEERLACESTTDGMIAIIQDLGSKFGTTVTYEDEKSKVQKEPDEAADSNDETDDEEVIPQMSQQQLLLEEPSSQVSGVASRPSNSNSNTIMKKIEKNASFILASLSTNTQPDEPTNDAKTSPSTSQYTVTIQCGSAIVVITRIPLHFCLSRIAKPDENRMRLLAPQIGASISTKFDPVGTTHLCSTKDQTTAKNICAWIQDLPTVSIDFFNELLDRKQLNDDMPKEENYPPPRDHNSLVRKSSKVDDSTITRRWMSGFKVLSLNNTEIEVVCQCSGAQIVRLYRKVANSKKLDRSFWMNTEWWDELMEQQQNDGLMIVWINADKYSKEKNYLKKIMTERSKDQDKYAIHCVDTKDTASAITEFRNLVDVEGRELIPRDMPCIQNGVAAKYTSNSQENRNIGDVETHTVQENIKTSEEDDVSMQDMVSKNTSQKESEVTSNAEGGISSVKEELSGEDSQLFTSMKVSSKSKSVPIEGNKTNEGSQQKHSIASKHSQEQEGVWISSQNHSQKSSKAQSQNSIKDEATEQTSNVERNDGSQDNEQDGHSTMAEQFNDVSMDISYEEDNQKKVELPTTNDGWMVIAPKSKKQRRQYKRSKAELAELGEEFLLPPAETDICKDLIIRTVQEAEEQRRNNMNLQNNNRNKIDFKRFKKNLVISGSLMHNISGIRMRSETPKESARQRELLASMQALEKEQRAADALFHVEGHSQSQDQSILSFFKSPTATTNKGRGRRRKR